MANENKNVLRHSFAAANANTELLNLQLGYQTDDYKIAYKEAGGTLRRYPSEDSAANFLSIATATITSITDLTITPAGGDLIIAGQAFFADDYKLSFGNTTSVPDVSHYVDSTNSDAYTIDISTLFLVNMTAASGKGLQFTGNDYAGVSWNPGSGGDRQIIIDQDGNVIVGSSTTALDMIFEGNTSVECIDTGVDGRVIITTEGIETARFDLNHFFGLGTSSPSVLAHFQAAVSEQFRIGYNATFYTSFGVNSSGNMTITPQGTTVTIAGLMAATTISGVLVDGVTCTTQAPGDSTTKVASTEFVTTAIAALPTTFLALTDTISGFTSGRLLYESGAAVVDSANLTFSGTSLYVSGNIGITNTTPSTSGLAGFRNLVVGSTADATSGITIQTSTTGTGGLIWNDSNGGARGYISYYNDSALDYMLFGTNGGTRATLDKEGKFGINCTPSIKMEVLDTSAAQLRLTHTATTYVTDFQTTSTGNLVITPTGSNVGINKTPEAWLGTLTALQIGGNSSIVSHTAEGTNSSLWLYNNVYVDGDYKRITADETSFIQLGSGYIYFKTDTAGAADTGFPPTERMAISPAGDISFRQGENTMDVGGEAPYALGLPTNDLQIVDFVSGASGYTTDAGYIVVRIPGSTTQHRIKVWTS